MVKLDNITKSLETGNSREIRSRVQEALNEGINYKEILNAMLKTMEVIGDKFRRNVVFVPEVLIIGKAFNVALDEIRPYIKNDNQPIGTVVMGTVLGDHHDVGKNILKVFFESSNIEVIDLGINVAPHRFVDAIIEYDPDFLAMSALLTTTMVEMENVITKIEEANLREDLKIIIGGAPITQSFALNIGADHYSKDAYGAVEIVKDYLNNK